MHNSMTIDNKKWQILFFGIYSYLLAMFFA